MTTLKFILHPFLWPICWMIGHDWHDYHYFTACVRCLVRKESKWKNTLDG